MIDVGELRMAQEHGGQPTMLVAGSTPGESGVTVLRAAVRFFSDSFNVALHGTISCGMIGRAKIRHPR
jgi:hypothetical protein